MPGGSARRSGPEMPRGEFLLEPPPEMAERLSGGIGQYVMYLPMIGFLFILNTYTIDLGLKVAELRVTRPGAAPPG